MKYFWLSPKLQRSNNWVFYSESNETGVRLHEQFVPLQCKKCKKFDAIQAIALGVPAECRIRSASDYFLTSDGLICVSELGEQILKDLRVEGVNFLPISKKSRFSVVIPSQFLRTDMEKTGMEFHRPCSNCARPRETCGSPALAAMALPADEKTLCCPSVANENSRGRVFWYFVAESLANAFRASKLKGVDYQLAD